MSGLRALKRVRLRKRLDGETADVSGLRALKDCEVGEKIVREAERLDDDLVFCAEMQTEVLSIGDERASKTGVGLRLGVLRLEVGDSKFEGLSVKQLICEP